MSIETRFWAKVERQDDADCWPWTAARHECGYGLRVVGSGPEEPQRSLALEFGVGAMTVNHIALGRTWRHVVLDDAVAS